MLRTSTVCCELPPSSPLKGLKFFFKNFFCPGSRTGAGGAPGDTRGFARRLKDYAHICCIYDKRTFNIEWNSFFSLSWKKGKIRKTIINATPSARFRTAHYHRKLIRHLDLRYLKKVFQLLIWRSLAPLIRSSPNLPYFPRPLL